MKKLSVLMILLLTACSVFAPAAAGKADDIPERVAQYAEGPAAAAIKAFMKDPANGYIGSVISSAEEADALCVGRGYRLWDINVKEGASLAESAAPADQWLFSLDGIDGAVVFFGVSILPENGELTYFGADDAYNLSSALKTMERLAEKAHVSFDPMISVPFAGCVVAQSFNGDERVITVPGTPNKLDGSYLAVSSFEELPTYEEYASEVIKSFTPAVNASTGEAVDLLSYSGGGTVELLPHSVRKPSAAIPIAICAAAAVAIPIIALVVRRRKVSYSSAR